MEYFLQLLDFIIHIDTHLLEMTNQYGVWVYVILFVIIFCETGLVITPFLPGDSLLFAGGAIAATNETLNVHLLFFLLLFAAVLGDAVNYHIGYFLGEKAFDQRCWTARFLKKKHLERTEAFYQKYGGKTIIIARFVPIVRTFAPFLAGVGSMSYAKFLSYNIFGALLWTTLFLYAGFYFGNLDYIKNNFSLVILGIIVISVLPIVVEYCKSSFTKE
ncbi:MAG: DedA family protein [Deltaproteobacteria bacterium]|jgi:membrane-associated protein|nr:DedA family protein [Deltaproteobacteria bacterium]